MFHLSKNSNYYFKIDQDRIPISKHLKKYISKKNLDIKKFTSKGDDYQILFTASKKKRSLIGRIAKKTKTLVTRVGVVISEKPKFMPKNKGYKHNFNK